MCNLPLLILGMIGWPQLLVIVALVVIFFGGKKIPEMMRGMGRGIKEFKDAINKDYTADAPKNETTAPAAKPQAQQQAQQPTDETTKQA
ncbi:MAG: twin-arginine translocase TatA/TatE family subunit [Alistipes sp.]|nr:twin-arginine translocase TatA/TatE family subunit [Alistipes sp.]